MFKFSFGPSGKSTTYNGWKDFLLNPELIHSLQKNGIGQHPSELQWEVLPQLILGASKAIHSKSGYGKTIAYIVALLQELGMSFRFSSPSGDAIVVCPTEDLAVQVFGKSRLFAEPLGASVGLFCGSLVDTWKQGDKPCSILVCTPRADIVPLAAVAKYIVLDEYDALMDSEDSRKIIESILEKKQPNTQAIACCSLTPASDPTMSYFVSKTQAIATSNVKSDELRRLRHFRVVVPEPSKKFAQLCDLLDATAFNTVLIFCNSSATCNTVAEFLRSRSFPLLEWSEETPAQTRFELIASGEIYNQRIIVATDVLSRGFDIPTTDVVINFDLPADTGTYYRRAGRAGRFGRTASVFSIVEAGDLMAETFLLAVQEQFEIEIPPMEEANKSDDFQFGIVKNVL